jgi:uncharacterized protein involved in type VI secretion and phage assembly
MLLAKVGRLLVVYSAEFYKGTSMFNDPGLMDVVERLRNRFWGKYRGTVTEVDAETMRIKAKVPAVLKDQTTGWAMPCVPYAGADVGFAFLPEVGSGVWIEFEGGEVSYPVWVGCYWHTGEVPADAKDTVKAIVTVAGHKLLFDDDAGSITLTDGNGNEIVLDSSGIAVTDANGNKITMDSAGIKLERQSMNVEIATAKVSVNSGALDVM